MRWKGFRKVRQQVAKRVSRRIRALNLGDPAEYRAFLEGHPEEWEILDACCRVTISRFFRDREFWSTMQTRLLPELARRSEEAGQDILRVWSAGCCSGEEPFTISILWRMARESGPSLAETHPGLELRILATDLDPVVLERAREGLYPSGSLKDVPVSWVSTAFQETDGGFLLRNHYREGVSLSLGDIRTIMPEGPFHLIACRNLAFTYFEEDLQAEVLSALLQRLEAGGGLVIGGHEALPGGPWPLVQPVPGLPIFEKTA